MYRKRYPKQIVWFQFLTAIRICQEQFLKGNSCLLLTAFSIIKFVSIRINSRVGAKEEGLKTDINYIIIFILMIKPSPLVFIVMYPPNLIFVLIVYR